MEVHIWRLLANTTEPSMCVGDAAFLLNYLDHLLMTVLVMCVQLQRITARTSATFCSKAFSTSLRTGSVFTRSCLAKSRWVWRRVPYRRRFVSVPSLRIYWLFSRNI